MHNLKLFQQINNSSDSREVSNSNKPEVHIETRVQNLLNYNDARIGLEKILNTKFQDAPYIVSKFHDALNDPVILESLRQASVNSEFAKHVSVDRKTSFDGKIYNRTYADFYTDFVRVQKIQRDDHTYITKISWLEHDHADIKTKTQEVLEKKYMGDEKLLAQNYEAHLYIFDRGNIFIPPVRHFDLENLRFHAGMHNILEKYLTIIDFAVMKEMIEQKEVVKLIGDYSSWSFGTSKQIIEVKYSAEYFFLRVTSPTHDLTYHRFQTKYAFGLFPKVFYSKEVIPSSVLQNTYEEHDAKTINSKFECQSKYRLG